MRNTLTSITLALAVLVNIGANAPAVAQGGWYTSTFPPPNGGRLVYKIMSNGDPACASYNGHDCLWGQPSSQITFNRVHLLTCGADHRRQWGVTGYENPKHWCSLAKSMHPKSVGFGNDSVGIPADR